MLDTPGNPCLRPAVNAYPPHFKIETQNSGNAKPKTRTDSHSMHTKNTIGPFNLSYSAARRTHPHRAPYRYDACITYDKLRATRCHHASAITREDWRTTARLPVRCWMSSCSVPSSAKDPWVLCSSSARLGFSRQDFVRVGVYARVLVSGQWIEPRSSSTAFCNRPDGANRRPIKSSTHTRTGTWLFRKASCRLAGRACCQTQTRRPSHAILKASYVYENKLLAKLRKKVSLASVSSS